MIDGKATFVDCPPPKPFQASPGTTLIPSVCTEWTIIIIEGPKKVTQIIQRFNFMQQINVTKIRCDNSDLYDKNSKKNPYLQQVIDKIPVIAQNREDRNSIELHIQAEDKNGKIC